MLHMAEFEAIIQQKWRENYRGLLRPWHLPCRLASYSHRASRRAPILLSIHRAGLSP